MFNLRVYFDARFESCSCCRGKIYACGAYSEACADLGICGCAYTGEEDFDDEFFGEDYYDDEEGDDKFTLYPKYINCSCCKGLIYNCGDHSEQCQLLGVCGCTYDDNDDNDNNNKNTEEEDSSDYIDYRVQKKDIVLDVNCACCKGFVYNCDGEICRSLRCCKCVYEDTTKGEGVIEVVELQKKDVKSYARSYIGDVVSYITKYGSFAKNNVDYTNDIVIAINKEFVFACSGLQFAKNDFFEALIETTVDVFAEIGEVISTNATQEVLFKVGKVVVSTAKVVLNAEIGHQLGLFFNDWILKAIVSFYPNFENYLLKTVVDTISKQFEFSGEGENTTLNIKDKTIAAVVASFPFYCLKFPYNAINKYFNDIKNCESADPIHVDKDKLIPESLSLQTFAKILGTIGVIPHNIPDLKNIK